MTRLRDERNDVPGSRRDGKPVDDEPAGNDDPAVSAWGITGQPITDEPDTPDNRAAELADALNSANRVSAERETRREYRPVADDDGYRDECRNCGMTETEHSATGGCVPNDDDDRPDGTGGGNPVPSVPADVADAIDRLSPRYDIDSRMTRRPEPVASDIPTDRATRNRLASAFRRGYGDGYAGRNRDGRFVSPAFVAAYNRGYAAGTAARKRNDDGKPDHPATGCGCARPQPEPAGTDDDVEQGSDDDRRDDDIDVPAAADRFRPACSVPHSGTAVPIRIRRNGPAGFRVSGGRFPVMRLSSYRP